MKLASKLPDLSISDDKYNDNMSPSTRYNNHSSLQDRVQLYSRKKNASQVRDHVKNSGSGFADYAKKTNDSFFSSSTTKNSNLGYESPTIRKRHYTQRKNKTNSEFFKINSLGYNKSQTKNWEKSIPTKELKIIIQ